MGLSCVPADRQRPRHLSNLVQGRIFIIGGIGGGGTRDGAEESPLEKPGLPVASDDRASGGIVKGSAAVAPAGDSFSHTNSVYMYDVAAAEWCVCPRLLRLVASVPRPRS